MKRLRPRPLLSPREAQVAQGVHDGLHKWEIAERLGVSVNTVRCLLERIYVKTGHRNMVQLAVWYERQLVMREAGLRPDEMIVYG